MSRQAHLIGSIGLENAETAMTKAAEILGPRCSRIPDGETGGRGYWIRWQQSTFDNCKDLQEGMVLKVERLVWRLQTSLLMITISLRSAVLGAATQTLSLIHI